MKIFNTIRWTLRIWSTFP